MVVELPENLEGVKYADLADSSRLVSFDTRSAVGQKPCAELKYISLKNDQKPSVRAVRNGDTMEFVIDQPHECHSPWLQGSKFTNCLYPIRLTVYGLESVPDTSYDTNLRNLLQ